MDSKSGMNEAYVISHEDLLSWVDSLMRRYDVYGPVKKKRGQVVFEQIKKADDLDVQYCSTMLGPRQFIYPSRQILFDIDRQTGKYHTVLPERTKRRLIFAIHPCDMHAISVLDKTFLGVFKDIYYKKLREDTLTVVLNCNQACDNGFCASMETGPFLHLKDGFDVVLTAKLNNYLVEFGSKRGVSIITKTDGFNKATRKDFAEKKEIETKAKQSFTKHIDTTGLPELLMRNLDHPVYKRTAEARCLGCTNCTMVCPTCYCYNIEDKTSYNLESSKRSRYWDSCQELNFAIVHEGNFRSSRQARLRQFVTHKLATWVEQYGCFGCIGCGRCMTWCPTKIDLTEMAKEIQQDVKIGRAR
jgi:sulfhydrogenase subunit beta (sulfur reductase)